MFFPTPDNLLPSQPRIDFESGENLLDRNGKPDTRIVWTDVTGRKATAVARDKANDLHVKGPFETGWEFADSNKIR
uniref:hypothetical protein n=1 Tax=Cupriavidus taiwanensis TaxID=164546 RepID=UPI0011C059AC|nr:hypothetical protein [Cupriavidus taiwanensis]